MFSKKSIQLQIFCILYAESYYMNIGMYFFFKTQGQKKVASMMESKEIHKGIFQIEWEHKKMEMEMEDLNQKAWDIQMLFFSRDRQKVSSPCPPRYNFNFIH